MHVPAGGPTSVRAAEAFPLSAALGAGGLAASAGTSPGRSGVRRPHRLLRAAAETAGGCLAERRGALRCCQPTAFPCIFTSLQSSAGQSASMLLLRCCVYGLSFRIALRLRKHRHP